MKARLAIMSVIYVMFTATFANNAPSPLYVIYQHELKLSPLMLTAVFSVYAWGVLTGLLTLGRLSDEIGRKPMLILGSTLVLAGTLLFATAHGLGNLFAARAVQGIATGIIASAATAAIVDLERDHDRTRASRLVTLAFLSGAALGPLSFGFMAQYLARPTRFPFVVEIVLDSAALVALMAFVPRTAPEAVRSPRQRFRFPRVPRNLLRPFVFASASLTIGWGIGGIYGSLSPSMAQQLLHLNSHALAGIILFIFASLGGTSQMIWRRLAPRTAMLSGVMSTGVALILLELALFRASPMIFAAATVMAGVGNGLAFIGSLSVVNAIAPIHQRAELIAVYNIVGYLALAIPVIGVGILANIFGLRTATGIFAIIVGSLAAITTVMLVRERAAPAVHSGTGESLSKVVR